jgi:hypothetical protein
LVDNGHAPLTLLSFTPSLVGLLVAHDFSLLVKGAAFTATSVVRWNGSTRPTTFIDSSTLKAAIPASDVSALGEYPITVYDPLAAVGGPETAPLILRVIPRVFSLDLPQITR